jgi:hypothetical protein
VDAGKKDRIGSSQTGTQYQSPTGPGTGLPMNGLEYTTPNVFRKTRPIESMLGTGTTSLGLASTDGFLTWAQSRAHF